jgi:hypothetical protein
MFGNYMMPGGQRAALKPKIAEKPEDLFVFRDFPQTDCTSLWSYRHSQWPGTCAANPAMRVRPPESRARNPADSLPYSVVAAELETFLADQREREHEVAW